MFKFKQSVWEESRMIGGFSRLMRLFAFPCSIYFKSVCLITIPLLDAVTFDALSWSHGRRRNKRTFHPLHYLQDHLQYFFQDLDSLTWVCALLANSNNCIFTIFIQSDISNVISNALLGTSQSQSGFNNGNILQIMFASVTPIGPPEKCKVAAYMQYKQFF